MKGYKLITIGGKERPLKFGTNQTAKYCEVRKISLQKYYEELAKLADSSGSGIRDLIFSALWAGAKTDKIDIDFDEFDVGDWMDEVGTDDLTDMMKLLYDSNDSGEGEDEKGKKD